MSSIFQIGSSLLKGSQETNSGDSASSQQSSFVSSFRYGLSLMGVSSETVKRCEDQMKHYQEQALQQCQVGVEQVKQYQDQVVLECQEQTKHVTGWVQITYLMAKGDFLTADTGNLVLIPIPEKYSEPEELDWKISREDVAEIPTALPQASEKDSELQRSDWYSTL